MPPFEEVIRSRAAAGRSMAMAGAGTAFVGGSLALAPLKVFLLDAEDGAENDDI